MIEAALTQLLRERSGLTPDGEGNYSIFPSTQTDPVNTAMPRILYTIMDGDEDMTDDGPIGIVSMAIQLDIFTAKAIDGRLIVEKLRRPANATNEQDRGINGYAGTIDNTQIMLTTFGTRRVAMAVHIEGQNQTVARNVLELNTTYRELPEQNNE